ncbi:hypothetical protein D1BOALGB6SA_5221 [Olavius sp. associated proteobacterium Delta 1]|nr:hypothetical protein D1BOALGB6SA_5221 [Olavius sp. associated proteobacterium Delta 1]
MNQPPKYSKHIRLDNLRAIALVIISLILIAGCTAKYGSLKQDAEVQQAFESNRLPMDYKYFYYGDSEPYVLFGIEPRYEMDSKMWRDIAPDTAEFEDMTRWIWEDYGYYKFGADILDPNGIKVGIMYTAIRETSVKFVGDNQIVVIPNTPFLWGPESGGGGGIRVP